jgi:hypothetical protein
MKDLIVIDRDTAEKLLTAAGFTLMSMNSEICRITEAKKYPSHWIASDIREAIYEFKDAIKQMDDSCA